MNMVNVLINYYAGILVGCLK